MDAHLGAIRIGIVGYGYWGSRIARNVSSSLSVDLVAIADPAPSAREQAHRQHPTVATFASFDQLLRVGEIDAIVLAAPASYHARYGLAVLRSDRHLLVEKPLALDLASASHLVKEAEKRCLVLMAGHTFLYAPAVIQLRQLIAEGSLGRIKSLHSQRLLGQARNDCDAVWDLAPHDVSLVLHLCAELPDEVTARGFAHTRRDLIDTCFANMTFPSGAAASIHVSWVNPYKVRLLTLICAEGMAVFDDVPIDEKLTIYNSGLNSLTSPAEASSRFERFDLTTRMSDAHIPKLPTVEPLTNELEDFGKACAGGQAPVANGRFSLNVVAVLETISAAIRSPGIPVRLDWESVEHGDASAR
jgi:predicted dehydrogenase